MIEELTLTAFLKIETGVELVVCSLIQMLREEEEEEEHHPWRTHPRDSPLPILFPLRFLDTLSFRLLDLIPIWIELRLAKILFDHNLQHLHLTAEFLTDSAWDLQALEVGNLEVGRPRQFRIVLVVEVICHFYPSQMRIDLGFSILARDVPRLPV
jgi:hypothetical protein